MTATTIRTPRGSVIRSSSQRRFVVVAETIDSQGISKGNGHIERRSDSVDTLRTFINRKGGVVGHNGERTLRTIFDNHSGKQVNP